MGRSIRIFISENILKLTKILLEKNKIFGHTNNLKLVVTLLLIFTLINKVYSMEKDEESEMEYFPYSCPDCNEIPEVKLTKNAKKEIEIKVKHNCQEKNQEKEEEVDVSLTDFVDNYMSGNKKKFKCVYQDKHSIKLAKYFCHICWKYLCEECYNDEKYECKKKKDSDDLDAFIKYGMKCECKEEKKEEKKSTDKNCQYYCKKCNTYLCEGCKTNHKCHGSEVNNEIVNIKDLYDKWEIKEKSKKIDDYIRKINKETSDLKNETETEENKYSPEDIKITLRKQNNEYFVKIIENLIHVFDIFQRNNIIIIMLLTTT